MTAYKLIAASALMGMLAVSAQGQTTVSVNESQTHQTITGLGGQHVGGWTVKQGPFWVPVDLDAIHFYDTLIQDLGLSFVRYFVNLSSQPRSPQTYTFNAESRTNIGYWLKLKAAANRAGFDLKVVATILSAPVYMKWVQEDQSDAADGLDPQYYDELAQHDVSYLRAAKDSFNLDHYAFSPQNEPYFNEPYSQINYFNNAVYTDMFRVVAPVIKAYAPTIKIFFPEHMGRLDWETGPTWDRIIHDGALAPYADVGAVHSYIDGIAPDLGSAAGWTALYDNINAHSRPLWMTETSGYNDSTFAGGMEMVKSLFAALKYGCISGWSYLNTAGAGTSGSSDCFMRSGVKTHLYYASKQFFRFARPSMVQVTSSATDAEVKVLAFYQQARSGLGIIMVNLGAADKSVNISVSGSYVPTSYTVMRYSATDNNTVQQAVAPSGIVLKANSVTSLWAGPDPIGISGDATPVAQRPAAAGTRTGAARQFAVYDLQGRLVAAQRGLDSRPATSGSRVYLYREKRTDGAVVTGTSLY